jgi:hypothetical protein
MSLRTRILLLVLFATLVPAAITGLLRRRRPRADIARRRSSCRSGQPAHRGRPPGRGAQHGAARVRTVPRPRPRYRRQGGCSAFLAGVLEAHPAIHRPAHHPAGRPPVLRFPAHRQDAEADRPPLLPAGARPPTSLALEPAFGRLTGKAVLQIAYPARDDGGAVKFVLLASLDLDKFMRGRARGLPFESAVLMLMDRNGTRAHLASRTASCARARPWPTAPLHRLAQRRDGKACHEKSRAAAWPGSGPSPSPTARGSPGADLSVLVGVSKGELTAAADAD